MGDSLPDVSITDLIPSFAPSTSDPILSVNSNTIPIISADLPVSDGPESVPDAIITSKPTTPTTPTTPPPPPKTTPPPPPSVPTGSNSTRIRNGTLSLQPKPAALVGTNNGVTGSASTPRASNSNGVDASTLSGVQASVPIGAILGSVLAGVIMVTLAVTLLVALKRKKSTRNARLEPQTLRGAGQVGRAGLMEMGKQHQQEEEDVWATKAPKLPPLQLSLDVVRTPSPSLEEQVMGAHVFRVDVPLSPHHESEVFHSPESQGLHPSAPFGYQQRPDSMGSIQDAPMNYVVALEERAPRSNLRVMNRVSNASVDD